MNKEKIGKIELGDDNLPYAMIPNEILNSVNLSLQAKGLICILLSNNKEWVIYKSEIIKRSSNGKHSTVSAWKELEDKGYIIGVEQRDSKGRFLGINYKVYRSPNSNENPVSENPQSENPIPGNQPLIITNSNKTKINKTNNNIKGTEVPLDNDNGKSIYHQVVEVFFLAYKKENGVPLVFTPIMGKKIKSLITKIKKIGVASDDELLVIWGAIVELTSKDNFIKWDLNKIDSNFNQIISNIKRKQDEQSINEGRNELRSEGF